jgi:L-threonylcarbamoyladenylate synthase
LPHHTLLTVEQAAQCLHDGKTIAYPTEAVFGLGCDPGNEAAVRQLLSLKGRPATAGLILIADQFERFGLYIKPVSEMLYQRALSGWPGPVSWLFPRADGVPDWLAGNHDTIALRLTAHPVCRALCAAFGGAVVSTSANPSSSEPAVSAGQVEEYFGSHLGGIVEGALGKDRKPSEIRDLVSGAVVRPGPGK